MAVAAGVAEHRRCSGRLPGCAGAMPKGCLPKLTGRRRRSRERAGCAPPDALVVATNSGPAPTAIAAAAASPMAARPAETSPCRSDLAHDCAPFNEQVSDLNCER